MIVKLSYEEILFAVIVGARRLIVSLRGGMTPAVDMERSWSAEIEGALAEAAVARATGKFFDPRVGKFKEKDVGDYHIRMTTKPHGCLIIRDTDPDGIYVLVIGQFGTYRIAGFIEASHAKTLDECRSNPNNLKESWFIPQDRLDRFDIE